MLTRETTLSIPGMRCAGCTERVTKVLERLEGVHSARVTLEDTTARVEHDPDRAPTEDLQAAIEKAGYTPSLQTT